MEDLQATVEISVDLGHFFNIDMFQRGFYQITVEPSDPSPIRSNLEVHMLKDGSGKCFCPASTNDRASTSKTIHILHRKQEVPLDHTFLFRCHRLVDSRKILMCMSSMKFQMDVKLCFCSADDESEAKTLGFEEVSTRTILLHIDPIQGLHAFTLVVFDYGFMAGVEMTVHASLVALHQPLSSTLSVCGNSSSNNIQTITLETILFRPVQKVDVASLTKEAISVHDDIVYILLSIFNYLKSYFTRMLQQIPRKSRYNFEFSDTIEKLERMSANIKGLSTKEEILDQANMNLASACSYVLALWSHILDVVCLNRHVLKKLSFTYHKKRTHRFQSLFFTLNNPRCTYDEQRMSIYNWIASEVRNSTYYQSLPPLAVESVENDGSLDALPIVFEDKFDVNCQKSPIFKQKENVTSAQSNKDAQNNFASAKPNESNQKVLNGGSSDSKIPHVLTPSDATLSINSKCITDMSGQPSVLHRNFSQEIFSDTLEEPDDLPKFGTTLYKKQMLSHNHMARFSGPGYIQNTHSEITDGVFHAFGAGYNLNLSAATLTTTMLSPADEPETRVMSNNMHRSVDDVPKYSKLMPTGGNVPSIEKEEPKLDTLTLEAFLAEDNETSQLRNAICEPDTSFSHRNMDEITRYSSDKFNNISKKVEVCSNGDVVASSHSKQEMRHNAEKSKLLGHLQFPGHLYCDLPFTVPLAPYLLSWKVHVNNYDEYDDDSHLIVLVHGLDGNSSDLRMVKTYLQLGVQSILKMTGKSESLVSYLMSVANERDTYDDLQIMTNKLVDEILHYIKYNYASKEEPKRISFVGHSLGGLLIRSAITHERLQHLRPRFHTFLSFSAPHLGTILNSSTLVNTGLWLMQKWKKSACLRQLSCKEESNLKNTFIYKLSKKPGLEFFTNILLVASADDRYVPYQSARIEMCKAAFKDKSLGSMYQEMINNIMTPVLNNPKVNLLRYHIVHSLPTATANSVIGRAAHIAVLDSDVFLEQFFLVTALQYFT